MDNNIRLSRQANLIQNPPSVYNLLIIGAGSIGSNALHVAVSTGFENITIIDPDVIGEENIYPGFFSQIQVDGKRNKVEALSVDIYDRYGIHVIYDAALLQQTNIIHKTFDIVIIGTDSLASRRMAWNIYADELCRGYWIDARMGFWLATVITVDMNNPWSKDTYQNSLSEETQGTLPCGEKATAPMTKGFIPGMIGQSLEKIVNETGPPYIQRYDMESMRHLVVPQKEYNQDE